jgi:voltage-gated potassium channel
VSEGAAETLDPDPDDEPSARERLATLLERRLDIPMALLAAVWATS